MAQSESDILKEFLVALGFKVDERGFKGFLDTLNISNKLIEGLAVGAFSAAAAVTAFAAKMTESQKGLFYANQLAGTSAENMNAFTAAASKVGVSVEAARSAVASFGLSLQTDPGKGAFLRILGIDPTQDPTKVLLDYIRTPMSDVMRSAADAQLGLSNEFIFTLMRNQEALSKGVDDYDRKLKDLGIDQGKIQRDAAEIGSTWTEIEQNIGLAADALYQRFTPEIKSASSFVKSLSEEMIKVGGGKESLIAGVGNAEASWLGGFLGNAMGKALRKRLDSRGKIAPPPANASEASPELVDLLIARGEHGKNGDIGPANHTGERALGMMQILPSTAREMAGKLKVPYDEDRLLNDAGYNRMLGTKYLNEMLQRYNGDVALAMAAYNAGPTAVDGWLKQYGDPRGGKVGYDKWASLIAPETGAYLARTVLASRPQSPAANDDNDARFSALISGLTAGYSAPSTDATLMSPSSNHDNHSQVNNYNQTNNFNITGGSPTQIADQISSELKSRSGGDGIRYTGNTSR